MSRSLGIILNIEIIEAEYRIHASLNYTIIVSDNSLSSVRRQPIFWINGVLLPIKLWNIFQWNFTWHSKVFIQENAYENVVYKNDGHLVSASMSWNSSILLSDWRHSLCRIADRCEVRWTSRNRNLLRHWCYKQYQTTHVLGRIANVYETTWYLHVSPGPDINMIASQWHNYQWNAIWYVAPSPYIDKPINSTLSTQ